MDTNSNQQSSRGNQQQSHASQQVTQEHAKPVKASEHIARTGSQPRRVSGIVKVIIGIIVFVAIAWVLSALRTKTPDSSLVTDSTDTASSTEMSAYAQTTPIVDGTMTYELGGVSFLFEPQVSDENNMLSTRIRLQLDNLTRNTVPIEVASYRLGTYRGQCSQVDADTYAMSSADKGALAFASCNYEGTGRQLAAFQEGKNIVVKARTVTENGSAQSDPMTQIISIDVTKIVQSSDGK